MLIVIIYKGAEGALPRIPPEPQRQTLGKEVYWFCKAQRAPRKTRVVDYSYPLSIKRYYSHRCTEPSRVDLFLGEI